MNSELQEQARRIIIGVHMVNSVIIFVLSKALGASSA